MDVLLALDIGGTKIAAGLVTREGMVIDRGRIAVRSNQSDENLFNDVAQLVDAMLTKARGQHGAQPIALGVGCAGPMTENAELVSPLNIPCWRDFPLVPRLRTLTGLPVFADGDAKALALGEGWKGAAKGHDNFLAMVVSTGVGGGIVLNGRLLDGASGNAGHIGHVIVEPSGRRCVCGAQCVATVACCCAIVALQNGPGRLC
jgi:glucokinase